MRYMSHYVYHFNLSLSLQLSSHVFLYEQKFIHIFPEKPNIDLDLYNKVFVKLLKMTSNYLLNL